MAFWANLLGYQAVWFAAVIGASRDASWIGILAAALFVAAQMSASDERRSDLLLVLCGVLAGIVLDGTLAGLGVLRYASHDALLPAPTLFRLAPLSMEFATVERSLVWLKSSQGE